MAVSRETVEHIAVLARLGLDPAEAGEMERQLGAILAYVGKLRELDTEGVEPTFHVLGRLLPSLPLRPDEPLPPLSPGAALANAPASERGCFLVPPVIPEEAEKGGGGG
ncbi:MAG: Asp-tRNA(Asn)/Glu-tRNA(Gln) amidotransferase subunit GatC [Acetobacteraceae bacterium]|nr:Asp-tRNA(Asn)/Glu-tRNA(Gln) amidotransferase subunit GatC [Acetobacteraceae bacterium]